jgi:integrin-linked kinase
VYYPAWMYKEELKKKKSERNWEECDMWSFDIMMWEIEKREVNFDDM